MLNWGGRLGRDPNTRETLSGTLPSHRTLTDGLSQFLMLTLAGSLSLLLAKAGPTTPGPQRELELFEEKTKISVLAWQRKSLLALSFSLFSTSCVFFPHNSLEFARARSRASVNLGLEARQRLRRSTSEKGHREGREGREAGRSQMPPWATLGLKRF